MAHIQNAQCLWTNISLLHLWPIKAFFTLMPSYVSCSSCIHSCKSRGKGIIPAALITFPSQASSYPCHDGLTLQPDRLCPLFKSEISSSARRKASPSSVWGQLLIDHQPSPGTALKLPFLKIKTSQMVLSQIELVCTWLFLKILLSGDFLFSFNKCKLSIKAQLGNEVWIFIAGIYKILSFKRMHWRRKKQFLLLCLNLCHIIHYQGHKKNASIIKHYGLWATFIFLNMSFKRFRLLLRCKFNLTCLSQSLTPRTTNNVRY